MLSDPRRQKQLQQFIDRLGLPAQAPVNWQLLNLALTDPTFSPEANYDRLEFVGDAVVKLTAAEFLYQTYPSAPAGELSAIRSILVSDRLLAQIADRYGFDRFLLMANSAIADRAGRETRLAACCEAVLAALFLSANNLSLIHPWLNSHFRELAEMIRQDPTLHNYKGALQAVTQANYQTLPDYRVTEVNKSYAAAERFQAEVWLMGQCWGKGVGQSKKAAEQAAAREAFLTLQQVHQQDGSPTG